MNLVVLAVQLRMVEGTVNPVEPGVLDHVEHHKLHSERLPARHTTVRPMNYAPRRGTRCTCQVGTSAQLVLNPSHSSA